MYGAVQRAGDGDHFLHRLVHGAALFTHMHRHRDASVSQRFQRTDQLLCRVKALRRIAQPQRNAPGAISQRPLHGAVEPAVVRRLQPPDAVARRIGAQHARTHQHSLIEGRRRLFQRCQIARHGFSGQVVLRLSHDGFDILQYLLPVFPAEGRGRQAAVAVDHSGQPLLQLQRPEAGAKGRQISVPVNVDKAGSHRLSPGVHHGLRLRLRQSAEGGDLSANDPHICADAVCTAAVQYHSSPDQQIIHCLILFLFCPHSSVPKLWPVRCRRTPPAAMAQSRAP